MKVAIVQHNIAWADREANFHHLGPQITAAAAAGARLAVLTETFSTGFGRGDKIAEMGSTDAERVQLHFEIRKGSSPVDPMPYLDKGGST